MRRIISATMLLYPRGVRHRHGAELESLVEELIQREGASRPRVMTRLALDGVSQRLRTRTTALVMMGTLGLSSVGGLAVSDFAAASARGAVPAVAAAHAAEARTSAVRGPRPEVRRGPDRRARHASRRSAGIIK